MVDIYMQNILDHNRDPENYGKLENPTHQCGERSASCGDQLQVYLQVSERDIVEKVSFEGSGCSISQAAMSILSSELIGMSRAEIEALDGDYMIDLLGIDLGPMRLKCALLSLETVRCALIS